MDKLKRYEGEDHGEPFAFCLSSDVEKLEARVKDYEDTQRTIMSERCGDEVHCTCVPPLRAEVKRLTAELTALRTDVEKVIERFRHTRYTEAIILELRRILNQKEEGK